MRVPYSDRKETFSLLGRKIRRINHEIKLCTTESYQAMENQNIRAYLYIGQQSFFLTFYAMIIGLNLNHFKVTHTILKVLTTQKRRKCICVIALCYISQMEVFNRLPNSLMKLEVALKIINVLTLFFLIT